MLKEKTSWFMLRADKHTKKKKKAKQTTPIKAVRRGIKARERRSVSLNKII